MKRPTLFLVLVHLLFPFVCGIGCATMERDKNLRTATNNASQGNYQRAIPYFEKAFDSNPSLHNKSKYMTEIRIYRDTQVRFALEQSRAAEMDGRLVEAWIWLAQASFVDKDHEEMPKVLGELQRIRKRIQSRGVQDALLLHEAGENVRAVDSLAQSLWFGSQTEAWDTLHGIAQPLQGSAASATVDGVREVDVAGMVRSDSLERIAGTNRFAPYGIPIYFGDVRKYYRPLKKIKAKGSPYMHAQPIGAVPKDSLKKLTEKARKANGNAIVNVHIITKRKKTITRGEVVRTLDFDEKAEAPPVRYVRTRLRENRLTDALVAGGNE